MTGKPVDLDRLRSVGSLSRGRTRDQVTEQRLPGGGRTKAVTDENNATVTEHSKAGTGVSHRQDVMVRPSFPPLGLSVMEK
jgi:hypothetical protein